MYLRKFTRALTILLVFFSIAATPIEIHASAIGNNYEQQTPPAEGVDRPRVRIEYADEIYVGETTDLTAYEDIDDSGNPFFYWYADKGSFTGHGSYPNYDTVRFTAPSEPGTVWITAQVGDSLGYIGRQTIALNILPDPDDPGNGSGDCTSTLTSAEQIFDRSISYRLQLEQTAGGTQTGHFYIQPTIGDFTWYDSGAVRVLVNGTAVNLYTDSNLQNNTGKIVSYVSGEGKLSFWFNANFEEDAEIYIEQEENSASTWYPGPWAVDVSCSGSGNGGSGIADLIINTAETDPPHLGPGASTFTRAIVSNIGDGPADASALACYLSTNNTWDAADTLMYRHQFTNIIINGGNAFVEQNVTIPADLTSGDYYLIFRADDQSVVTEKNEGNNVAAVPVEVRTVAGADLTVGNPGVSPTNVIPGQTITLSARVTNSGETGTQASSRIGYYLSTDANWDSSDTLLGGSYFGVLQPGQSQDFTRTFTLRSLSAGQQYIIFYADYPNNVTEVSKDNNRIAVSIQNTEDSPAANDDTVVTEEDVAMLIAVLENDSPPTGETLDVTAVSTPANGTALLNGDDTITYTPNLGFTGSDAFTYTVTSPSRGTATATVYVTVNEAVSCSPWALPPDAESLARDDTGNIFVLGGFQDSITLGTDTPVILAAPAGTYALYIAKYTPSGTLLWAQKAVSTTSGAVHCKATVDTAGNLYIGGVYYRAIDFYKGETLGASLDAPYANSQGHDIFLAKYSPQGDPLWAEQAAGPWDEQGVSLSVDSAAGYVYLSGIFDGIIDMGSGAAATSLNSADDDRDPFLARYTVDGSLLWVTQLDGGPGGFNSIATGSTNTVLATGYYYNSITFRGSTPLTLNGDTGSNYFIAEFSANSGDIRWGQKGTGSCKGRAVAADNVGQIYVTGDFSQTCDFYDANTLFESLTSFGSNDMFMIKYQADGTPEWLHQGGGTSYDFGRDVTFDQDSNPLFIGTCGRFPVEFTIDGTGTTTSNSISCAASYDSNGSFIEFADPGNNLVMAQQSDGNPVVIGSENMVTPCD